MYVMTYETIQIAICSNVRNISLKSGSVGLNVFRDKENGMHRSGEGGGVPALEARIWAANRKESGDVGQT